MLKSALGYLAAADATAMAAETRAQCLQILEQASSIGIAARTSVLAAFTSAKGYSSDADYSPRAWLIHKTHITAGAAVGHTAWVRRGGGAAADEILVRAARSGLDVRDLAGLAGEIYARSRPQDPGQDQDQDQDQDEAF